MIQVFIKYDRICMEDLPFLIRLFIKIYQVFTEKTFKLRR